MRIRVLTFNVQHDAGDEVRTAWINAELRRMAPDVVALQEVCYPADRDQLAELIEGAGLGYTTHQADGIDCADQTDGSVLATRWPHRVVEILDHRPTADRASGSSLGCSRSAVAVRRTTTPGTWRARDRATRGPRTTR